MKRSDEENPNLPASRGPVSKSLRSVVRRLSVPRRPRETISSGVGDDRLLRNSVFLALTTGVMAAFGFLFWLLNARLYSSSEVGVATTLISGASLISYLSLLGFNTTFVRFLSESSSQDMEINTGTTAVLITSATMALAYAILSPYIAPELRTVFIHPANVVGFVILTACWSVNLVTDSVFIAIRKAQCNLMVDGFVVGVVKLTLPLFLVTLGAFGIFMASGLSSLCAVVASIILMMRNVKYSPRIHLSWSVLRRTWNYSLTNYIANVLSLSPALVTPLVVLRVLGAREAAYYFVAFQIGGVMFAASYAISSSFFAEGSRKDQDIVHLAKRAAKILLIVSVICGLVVAVAARLLLLPFGVEYSRQAEAALAVLGLSSPAVALYSIATAFLRVSMLLSGIVVASVVYATAIIVLTVVGAHCGLTWVAGAWLVGNVCGGLVAAAFITGYVRRLRHVSLD